MTDERFTAPFWDERYGSLSTPAAGRVPMPTGSPGGDGG